MKIKGTALIVSALILSACADKKDQTQDNVQESSETTIIAPDDVNTVASAPSILPKIQSEEEKGQTINANQEVVEDEEDESTEPTLNKLEINLPNLVNYPISGFSLPNLYSKWKGQATKPKLNNNPNICNDVSITPLILLATAQEKGFIAIDFPKTHVKNPVDTLRWSDLDVKKSKLSPKSPLIYTVAIEAEMDKPTSISVMKNDVKTLWEDDGQGRKKAESKDNFLYVEITQAETLNAEMDNGNLSMKCKVDFLIAEGYRAWDGLLFTDRPELPITSFLPFTSDIKKQERNKKNISKTITIKENKGSFKVDGV